MRDVNGGPDVETTLKFSTVIPIWFIDGSTGCSCCADDNFTSGPYLTEAGAQAAADDYRSRRYLASQYSKTGNYYIRQDDGELLPDGRIICGGSVYEGVEERRAR